LIEHFETLARQEIEMLRFSLLAWVKSKNKEVISESAKYIWRFVLNAFGIGKAVVNFRNIEIHTNKKIKLHQILLLISFQTQHYYI
jgi:NADH/NAD ratio-sensing transcriptional regulator Rex